MILELQHLRGNSFKAQAAWINFLNVFFMVLELLLFDACGQPIRQTADSLV